MVKMESSLFSLDALCIVLKLGQTEFYCWQNEMLKNQHLILRLFWGEGELTWVSSC